MATLIRVILHRALAVAAVALVPALAALAALGTPAMAAGTVASGGSRAVPSAAPLKETRMSLRATGTFEVKLARQPLADPDADPKLGRMSIDKVFSGDLQGTARGEMLMAGTETKGSAGYVAIERVNATLAGRSGTFVLQHSGTMGRGEPQLAVTVVPDSGTGQLSGLAGTLKIIIADGRHGYEFDYSLPVQP
jgi:hypothetical protein